MHSCSPSNYMVQFCSVSHIFLFFCCLVFVEMRFPKLETSIVLTGFKRHHESIWQRWTHGAFAANSSPKLILWIYNLQLKKLLSGEVSRMDAISPHLMHGETETRKNDEKLDSLCIHIVILVPKTLTTSHKLLYFHHLSSHAEAPTKAFLQVRYRCEIFNNVQGLPHDPIRRYTVGFTVHWCHRYIFKSVYPSKPDSYTGYTASIVTSGLRFDCILLQIRVQVFEWNISWPAENVPQYILCIPSLRSWEESSAVRRCSHGTVVQYHCVLDLFALSIDLW